MSKDWEIRVQENQIADIRQLLKSEVDSVPSCERVSNVRDVQS